MSEHPDRFRVGAALLALLGVVGLYAFLQSPYFAITEVRVEGAATIDPASLIERAQIRIGDNVLHVDLHAVASRLASHPRIQHAAVVRRLPGALLISVTEYEPVAVLELEEERVGVAADGTRIPLVPGEEEQLPAVAGVPEEMLPLALRASALLPAAVRREMAAIGFDDEAGLWLVTRSGTRILVGDEADLERKLAIVTELVQAGRWRLIDVRYPRSPVVRSQ
ncbi:MAG TPA: FtsQ-type POTRA domain-containing protein [Limnochordales bacterium]